MPGKLRPLTVTNLLSPRFYIAMKKVTIIFFSLLLTACSSQFAYNNLDWLVHWYIDDFIDFNDAQEEAFDVQFARWHSWHRKEELIKYEAHLRDLKAMLESGEATPDEVLAQFDRGRGHWERFRAHVLPDIAELSLLITDEQVTELFDTLEEKNAKEEEERREMTEEEMRDLFEESFADQLRDYFGKLTKTQKQLVKQHIVNIIPNRLEWIKYRRNIQSASRELMLSRATNTNYQTEFVAMFSNTDAYKHDLYIQNNEHNRRVFTDLLISVYKTLTAKQKKRVFRKIDNFIEDFSELREESSVPSS